MKTFEVTQGERDTVLIQAEGVTVDYGMVVFWTRGGPCGREGISAMMPQPCLVVEQSAGLIQVKLYELHGALAVSESRLKNVIRFAGQTKWWRGGRARKKVEKLAKGKAGMTQGVFGGSVYYEK